MLSIAVCCWLAVWFCVVLTVKTNLPLGQSKSKLNKKKTRICKVHSNAKEHKLKLHLEKVKVVETFFPLRSFKITVHKITWLILWLAYGRKVYETWNNWKNQKYFFSYLFLYFSTLKEQSQKLLHNLMGVFKWLVIIHYYFIMLKYLFNTVQYSTANHHT